MKRNRSFVPKYDSVLQDLSIKPKEVALAAINRALIILDTDFDERITLADLKRYVRYLKKDKLVDLGISDDVLSAMIEEGSGVFSGEGQMDKCDIQKACSFRRQRDHTAVVGPSDEFTWIYKCRPYRDLWIIILQSLQPTGATIFAPVQRTVPSKPSRPFGHTHAGAQSVSSPLAASARRSMASGGRSPAAAAVGGAASGRSKGEAGVLRDLAAATQGDALSAPVRRRGQGLALTPGLTLSQGRRDEAVRSAFAGDGYCRWDATQSINQRTSSRGDTAGSSSGGGGGAAAVTVFGFGAKEQFRRFSKEMERDSRDHALAAAQQGDGVRGGPSYSPFASNAAPYALGEPEVVPFQSQIGPQTLDNSRKADPYCYYHPIYNRLGPTNPAPSPRAGDTSFRTDFTKYITRANAKGDWEAAKARCELFGFEGRSDSILAREDGSTAGQPPYNSYGGLSQTRAQLAAPDVTQLHTEPEPQARHRRELEEERAERAETNFASEWKVQPCNVFSLQPTSKPFSTFERRRQ